MATEIAIEQQIFEQFVEIIRNIKDGNFDKMLQADTAIDSDLQDFVNYVNEHIHNLQHLEKHLPRMKIDISQLVESIHDVLQTIETASIRVLDNTDGILEQHDIIERTIKLLKQNPAIARVIGKRLDTIQQAQSKSRMFVFDTIQAQEFQELTKKQTETIIGSLEELQAQLTELQMLLKLRDDVGTGDTAENTEEPEIDATPNKQDSVDQLLAEFGL